MYKELKGQTIDKTDKRFADFPSFLDGQIYRDGDSVKGWETQEYISPEQEKLNITAEATKIIERQYSPLKQRKMMMIAIKLLDKKMQGFALTKAEEVSLQSIRECNDWITSIRDKENMAIASDACLADVEWSSPTQVEKKSV